MDINTELNTAQNTNISLVLNPYFIISQEMKNVMDVNRRLLSALVEQAAVHYFWLNSFPH